MTRKELSEVHWLNQQIIYLSNKLSNYNEEHPPIGSPAMTGMPSGGNPSSQVEKYVLKKTELMNQILDMRTDLMEQQLKVMEFIKGIDDLYLRQIVTLFCVDDCRWPQVANKMRTTPDSVRMYFNRHIGTYLSEEPT